MNAALKTYLLIVLLIFITSCNEEASKVSKPLVLIRADNQSVNSLSTQDIAHRKTVRLYEALTGTRLLDNNPLASQIESLVLEGKLHEAALKITHRYNGAKAFYNNVVKNFALPINRTHSIDDSVTDITAQFIGVTRDDGPIDDIFYGNSFYFDPTPNGNQGQNSYPSVFPTGNNLGHYDYVDQRGSLRDELVKSTNAAGDVGIFTSNAWAKSYYDAGTNRRPWKGIVEHFFCQEQVNIKTLYIPYDFVRRDPKRSEAGVADQFLGTCIGCHAQMDPISAGLQGYDYSNNNQTIVRKATFSEKINNPDNYPAGFTPTDDTWWLYYTDAQDPIFGFQNVSANTSGPAISFMNVSSGLKMATGNGLKDFARVIASSKGVAHCLAERMVLQLLYHKVWSLPNLNDDDKANIAAEKEFIDKIADEIFTTRKLKKAFESVAIEYAGRE